MKVVILAHGDDEGKAILQQHSAPLLQEKKMAFFNLYWYKL